MIGSIVSMGSMATSFRDHRAARVIDSIKHPSLRTERSLQKLMVEIDDKVLNFSKQNIDMKKAPKKGELFFAADVAPSTLLKRAVKLEDSLARFTQISDNRQVVAMDLTERSKK